VIIREASQADAAAIAGVHVASWRATYPGIVPQDYLDSLSTDQRRSDWHRILSDTVSPWSFYVAENDDREVVGFAGGGPERTGGRTYAGEMGAVYVLEDYQRLGIGRRLTAAVAGQLLRQGLASMLVWVLADNPFRAFYEALGGKPAGERRIVLGGAELTEVSYGWRDITGLARPEDPGFPSV
jgi:GNAT superfamily N-acetyltransferase